MTSNSGSNKAVLWIVGGMIVVNGNVTNCSDRKKYTGQWEADKKEGYGQCYSATGELLNAGTFRGDSNKYPIP